MGVYRPIHLFVSRFLGVSRFLTVSNVFFPPFWTKPRRFEVDFKKNIYSNKGYYTERKPRNPNNQITIEIERERAALREERRLDDEGIRKYQIGNPRISKSQKKKKG